MLLMLPQLPAPATSIIERAPVRTPAELSPPLACDGVNEKNASMRRFFLLLYPPGSSNFYRQRDSFKLWWHAEPQEKLSVKTVMSTCVPVFKLLCLGVCVCVNHLLVVHSSLLQKGPAGCWKQTQRNRLSFSGNLSPWKTLYLYDFWLLSHFFYFGK